MLPELSQFGTNYHIKYTWSSQFILIHTSHKSPATELNRQLYMN